MAYIIHEKIKLLYAMGRRVFSLLLFVIFCMPELYLSQACRSLPLRFHASEARKPYLFRRSRVELAFASGHVSAKQKEAPLSTAASLMALLGGKQQASSVDPVLTRRILPYLRFLVPPELPGLSDSSSHHGLSKKSSHSFEKGLLELSFWKKKAIVDRLIHWPPPAVADLARKVVEWNGDSAIILNSLSGESHLVPDVEGANERHCQLTKYTYGHRFEKKELNQYFAFLFEAITALAPSVGFNVTLNRFDLFHGHLFLAHSTGRLGILFHAREYPAFNQETFPVHLGYCQVGSPLPYDESMNLRNILWLAPMPDCSNNNGTSMTKWLAPGSLLVLDAHPEGIIYKDLVPDYVDVVRTVYEDDFGAVVVDVNYFNNALNDKSEDRIFIC